MIAGRLTEFVTLYQPNVVRDAFGAETITYNSTEEVRAEVKWKSGATSVSAAENFPGERLEILIRDAHTVAPRWRALWQGETYVIAAVERSRTKGFRRLVCDKLNG